MSEWPPKGTVDLVLPSGRKMGARLPDGRLFELCEMAVAMARQERGQGGMDIRDPQADIAFALATVLTYTCVNPRLSLKPRGPRQTHPDSMPKEDAAFIIRWALKRESLGRRGPLTEWLCGMAKARPKRDQRVN